VNKIRVLLADHTLIRAGLRMVVDAQPGVTVVGEASDGHEAVALAEKLKPGIAVMDIGMPNSNSIEASRQYGRSVKCARWRPGTTGPFRQQAIE
jgi:two-component system response regulator NreC